MFTYYVQHDEFRAKKSNKVDELYKVPIKCNVHGGSDELRAGADLSALPLVEKLSFRA